MALCGSIFRPIPAAVSLELAEKLNHSVRRYNRVQGRSLVAVRAREPATLPLPLPFPLTFSPKQREPRASKKEDAGLAG